MKNYFIFFSLVLVVTVGFQLQPSLITFDTEEGTYPSIAGTHKGLITPSSNIEIDTLYTYPCSGTGGHTKYIRIWNSTFETTAHWNGYNSNWSEIVFNKSFILVKDSTYNYTIVTGSYPQIIHEKEIVISGGKITCGEFVDTNGKIYNDWISCIKLYKK